MKYSVTHLFSILRQVKILNKARYFICLFMFFELATNAQVVSTLAGSRFPGDVDGAALSSSFRGPEDVAVDDSGNVYVADSRNHKIRKITPNGIVSTLAGSGIQGGSDGKGVSASFNYPKGIAVDINGNIYVADYENNKIRKITQSGIVSTFAGSGIAGSADGQGSLASFYRPNGVCVDSLGNIYVTDGNNHKVRKITPAGIVSTIAGSGINGNKDGISLSASFSAPMGVSINQEGTLFVSDYGNQKIRKISQNGIVSTLAGSGSYGSSDGEGESASFQNPIGITIDKDGNIYVADTDNHNIRKITPSGIVTTLAGTRTRGNQDGLPHLSSFYNPHGMTVDRYGSLYIADYGNNKIRKIAFCKVYTIDSVKSCTNYTWSNGVTYSTSNSSAKDTFVSVFGCDSIVTLNLQITQSSIYSVDSIVSCDSFTWVNGVTYYSDNNTAKDTFISLYGCDSIVTLNLTLKNSKLNVLVSTFAGSGVSGIDDGIGKAASFSTLYGIATDKENNVYVADYGNHKIRKITPDGIVSTFAGTGQTGNGDGFIREASFSGPHGVAIDEMGNIYVADQGNNKIRKITDGKNVSTFSGTGIFGGKDGAQGSAQFGSPSGIAVDVFGNVFVADRGNHKIRKITPSGYVSTFAGSGNPGSNNGYGNEASFYYPSGVAVDNYGNVYVADQGNNKIRKISSDGVVGTLAGSGEKGSVDDIGRAASFYAPVGVAVDDYGNVYVADEGNNKIRKISPLREVSTLAGDGTEGRDDGINLRSSFNKPTGIAMDNEGNLFVADRWNNSIRKIDFIGIPYIYEDTLICLLQGKVDLSHGVTNLFFSGTGILSDRITFHSSEAAVGKHDIEAIFTNEEGCESKTNFKVEVPESPSPQIVRQSSDQISTNQIYSSYQWLRNGIEIEGERSQILKVNELGLYSVEVNNNECYATSESYSFGIDKQHDNVLKKEDILVYPNPTTGVLYVEFLDDDSNHTILVTNSLGEKLLDFISYSKVVNLDISDFANGTYILSVSSSTSNQNFSIIKK